MAVEENALLGIVPILQGLAVAIEKAHPRSCCGACGCLLFPADPACPNCRLRLEEPNRE